MSGYICTEPCTCLNHVLAPIVLCSAVGPLSLFIEKEAVDGPGSLQCNKLSDELRHSSAASLPGWALTSVTPLPQAEECGPRAAGAAGRVAGVPPVQLRVRMALAQVGPRADRAAAPPAAVRSWSPLLFTTGNCKGVHEQAVPEVWRPFAALEVDSLQVFSSRLRWTNHGHQQVTRIAIVSRCTHL